MTASFHSSLPHLPAMMKAAVNRRAYRGCCCTSVRSFKHFRERSRGQPHASGFKAGRDGRDTCCGWGVAALIRERTGGSGVDVAVETAGHPAALKTALRTVKRGGKMSIVGLPPQAEIGFNVPFICDNEVDIYGIFRYANTYVQGVNFLASGKADLNSMITDRYPLEQTQEALLRAMTNKAGSLKVIVYPNEPGAKR